MSKGDKNRTRDRDAYRDTMERIKLNEAAAKKEDDEKWSALAQFLEFIYGGTNNEEN
jgi:hypothetical protein|tara:strand:- start:471 stop:641 length:171 start_codon:yes stop_codon:yes gene_type:complete